MALNIQTLKTRSLTAVVFVLVMLTGLLWNHWAFIVLFTIIHFGAWWEFIKLLRLIYPGHYALRLPLGLLYITMPCLMLIDLRLQGLVYKSGMLFADFGYIIPCGIIFSIWINDTMAYIVGSLIGKTPFSSISPRKTWEGTVGGALLCVIVISLAGYFTGFYTVKDWIIIAAVAAVLGTAGDLLESKLKRMAGVKDSGTFMPGHGGFLDRFDSLLVAVPLIWIYVRWLM